ncbi:hypothetical protein PMAYCL1PPCAC_33058, partial [Pristionchus mayeri]
FIHLGLGFVGIIANSLLIIAIARSRRNRFLKTYSLLLLNAAITDIIEGLADMLSMIRGQSSQTVTHKLIHSRVVLVPPAIIYIYQGVCGDISESTCFFMYSLIIHLSMHSIVLIAVSFWYRYAAFS